MAYRLQEGESVAAGIRRCAREQLESAIEKLTVQRRQDPVKAVHDARKALKKERSLLRLVRGSMQATQRRYEDDVFRNAGRSLSGVRDADVMIEALDQLAECYGDDAPQATVMTIRARLQEARVYAREQDGSDSAEQVAHDLRAALSRVEQWGLQGAGWDLLEPGLRRSYRTGQREMRRAHKDPTTESLHQSRKRAKDLWYHLRLLEPIAPNVLKGHADDAHLLSDLLGDDHDLAVLRETIAQMEHAIPANTDAIEALIERRRRQLQDDAFATGQRLYAERPKAFLRRLRSYWETWEAEAEGGAEKPRSRSQSSVSPSPS